MIDRHKEWLGLSKSPRSPGGQPDRGQSATRGQSAPVATHRAKTLSGDLIVWQCSYCKKLFSPHMSIGICVSKIPHKFCSSYCRQKSEVGLIKKNCEYCKGEFVVKNENHKFCSNDCANKRWTVKRIRK